MPKKNTSFEDSNPILITGGAGFLGSHMAALLLEKNYRIFVLDNLSNSNLNNLNTLEKHFKVKIPFFKIDLQDSNLLGQFFNKYKFDAVIHFAGLKSVNESLVKPDLYFSNNINGSIELLNCVKKHNIKKIIFSSSANVYGKPNSLPVNESHAINPTNPYGISKAKVEDLFLNDPYFENISVSILRYFNPVGSYHGLIGEVVKGVPNNLMPYILDVAKRKYEFLNIYGDDYDTFDGTGVRDYIHVMDLVEAHLHALTKNSAGCSIYNVGCGKGISVKEMVKTFESVNSISIPFRIMPRRDGDVGLCYANVDKIYHELGWKFKRNLNHMCSDAWLAVKNN